MTPTPDTHDPNNPPDHVLDIDDIADIDAVLDRATALKRAYREDEPTHRLEDHTLAMLFENPSTRTRISFETGMTRLGGHAIMLSPGDTQLGRGEPIKDTARAFSCYVDAVMARVGDHETLTELAENATVPVINGLTDEAHPCQTLADLFTIRETFGGFDVSAAWIGGGNNVASSFALGTAMTGIDLTVATPEGYGLSEATVDRAEELGAAPTLTGDPRKAVDNADVVYTDVWVSMGQEDETEERLAAFEGYQVNEDLLAGTNTRLMHCLPAHRGEEVTDDVIEGDRSLIWRQAENRMHAQNGLLVELLG